MINENYLKIYLQEIFYQIKCAKESLNARDVDDFARYHHFLIHCANIYKILFPSTDTWKKLSISEEEQKKIKKWREESLEKYFNNYKDLPIDKDFKEIRNHLEHFDERLDKIIIKCRGNVIDRNISIGGPLPIRGIERGCFLRNKENGTYTIMGDKFDIKKLWDWLLKIEDYIKNNQ